MKVRVTHYGDDPDAATVVTLTISDACPVCGGPRGRPMGVAITDRAGRSHFVHRWANGCGHHDLYADVIAEATPYEALSVESPPGESLEDDEP